MVDRLEKEYQGKVEFRRYDVDKDAEGQKLASRFNAQYVPTFVLLNKDGSTAQTLVGEMPEARLRAALDALR
ncbi:MAG: thioredoxin family protein [Coriobacteriia bacterium]